MLAPNSSFEDTDPNISEPNPPVGHEQLSVVLAEGGWNREAVQVFSASAGLSSDHGSLLGLLGWKRRASRQVSQGGEVFGTSIG